MVEQGGQRRRVIYCVVPLELAARLHEPLRDHFAGDPAVEVVVESRRSERRSGADRRAGAGATPDSGDRRRIVGQAGRRVGERRAAQLPAEPPELPRRARRFAARLSFVEREEPAGATAEEHDATRLATRFQAGDREAFAQLYLRYFDRVYGYMRVALRDSHEAEDATQQVFVNALQALPRFEPRRPFRSWLFTIVRNHALNRLRDSGRLEVLEPEAVERRIEANGDEEAEAEPGLDSLDWISDRDLLLFVERLPEHQRQAIVLRHVLGFTAAEIGQIMERSTDDVRMLQHRAHRFLRDRLAALGRAPRRSGTRRPRMRTRMREATVLRARRFSLR